MTTLLGGVGLLDRSVDVMPRALKKQVATSKYSCKLRQSWQIVMINYVGIAYRNFFLGKALGAGGASWGGSCTNPSGCAILADRFLLANGTKYSKMWKFISILLMKDSWRHPEIKRITRIDRLIQKCKLHDCRIIIRHQEGGSIPIGISILLFASVSPTHATAKCKSKLHKNERQTETNQCQIWNDRVEWHFVKN